MAANTLATPVMRLRSPQDVEPIRALMLRVYPPPHGPEAIWSALNLLRHLERFPEGQMVVEAGGILVGTSTVLRVSMEHALQPHTWAAITGSGSLSTHEPDGEVLYGANIAVDPTWQNKGIARLLYEGRIALGRRLGCRIFVAGARIPGYHAVAGEMTPEAYVQEVVEGHRFDPTLSKQLRVGFQVRGVLHDYALDHETKDHAALIALEL